MSTAHAPKHVDAIDPGPERESAMLAYRVSHDGHRYRYNGYRYDRWQDAVAQAELMLSRPLQKNPPGPFQQNAHVDEPTDADRDLMASLGVRAEAGVYRFEGYRYDRVADAIAYAKLTASRQSAETIAPSGST